MFTYYIMCLVLIILETNAENNLSDNPVIVINFPQDFTRDIIKYTVVKKKPLKIILKKYFPVSAKCISHYVASTYTEFYNKDYDDVRPDGIISVQNITDEMSTKWKCTVTTKYSLHDVVFNIHVKGAKKVSFSVNSWSLKPDISDQPSSKYDGEKVYEYLDGELIFLSCKTAIGTGAKRLKYYDAQGFLLFQTDEMSTEWIIFRSVLTARNNYFYIECEHSSTNPFEIYYYRLIFVLNNRVPEYVDEINLSVNDLTLAPRISNFKGTKYYNYYYEYGFESTLNVICQNNNHGTGHMGLGINSNTVLAVSGANKTSNIIETKQSTRNLNNKMLICTYTNINNRVALAKLKLKTGVVASATRILGLPEKNLEYQYTKNRSFYSMNYRYSSNETVQLTCVTNCANVSKIVWNYKNESITFEPEKNYTVFETSATLQFTFTPEYNATSIQCHVFDNYGVKNYTVDVFLNLDPENENQLFIIIGVAIAVMVVIIPVICALCWCARAKKKIIETFR